MYILSKIRLEANVRERERGLHDTKMHYFEAMNGGNGWEYS